LRWTSAASERKGRGEASESDRGSFGSCRHQSRDLDACFFIPLSLISPSGLQHQTLLDAATLLPSLLPRLHIASRLPATCYSILPRHILRIHAPQSDSIPPKRFATSTRQPLYRTTFSTCKHDQPPTSGHQDPIHKPSRHHDILLRRSRPPLAPTQANAE
jgi:hypothetical protein